MEKIEEETKGYQAPNQNNLNDLIPYSSIHTVQFYVLGSEENKIDSCIEIKNNSSFQGDRPLPGGVYDPHMGTTDRWICATCGNVKNGHQNAKNPIVCTGHSGSIQLRYPVKSPLFKDQLIKWLKILCFKCKRLIVNKTLKIPKNRLLMEYSRLASPTTTSSIKHCPYADCKEPKAKVIYDKLRPAMVYLEYTDKGGIKHEEPLYNHKISEILEGISTETLEKVGATERTHPKNYILRTIRIMPNTARPYIRRQVGNRANNSDDITTLTKQIQEMNSKLLPEIPDNIDQTTQDVYCSLEMMYYEMIKGAPAGESVHMTSSNGKAPKAIVQRLLKKDGRIRKHLLGKRCVYILRSVLTCDPSLEVDQMGIPLSIAREMQIQETVREYNREYLEMFFKNKTDIYPGCSHVIKASDGEKYRIDKVKSLEIGDIILRNLIDGDIIMINRQPSLLMGNIMAMRIVVLEHGDSIRINESACGPLNADFDGDAVNGIVVQSIQSRIEAEYLSWLGNCFISLQKHTPYFGCFQDSLIGSAQITRSVVGMNKWHAMSLFSNILHSGLKIIFDKPHYTGRQLISKVLPKINYPRRASTFYNEKFIGLIKYDPDETHVEINRGEIISGILDKKSVGQNSIGSIFHIINNEYGPRKALDTIHNIHQIIMRYFLWSGFTVGVRDIQLPDFAIAQIAEKTNKLIESAEDITEQLRKRHLIAPIGTPLKQYYESEQMNALEAGSDFVQPILGNMNFASNKLMNLVLYGSKGNINNAISIHAASGQMTIGSKRQSKNFGFGRTSPYFLRGDKHPCANGFIDKSYREGIPSDIFPFSAADTRYGETMKSLSTSVAGAQGRICTKNVESIKVGNLYTATKKEALVQPLYAENGIDPRKLVIVKFISIMISDKDLENKFHAKLNILDKFYQNKTVEKALTDEFECIVDDRNLFRDISFGLHKGNPSHLVQNEAFMPFNPFEIIENVLYNYKDDISDKSVKLDPIAAINKVKELCDNLAYSYYNRIQLEAKTKIPDYINAAMTFSKILIRSYLCVSNLINKKVSNKLLDIIINKIKENYKKALIPYGLAIGLIASLCVSEPQTQYVIDSKHRAGTGAGTKTNVIDRIKEIFGAKPTDKMKNPSMLIYLKSEFSSNKAQAQEIANNIEMMDFQRFIDSFDIFFEKYGKPEHPEYEKESKMITEYERLYSHIKLTNLSKWCIRFVVNKENMLLNGMKLNTIITKLRIQHNQKAHFIYTPENSDKIIIRCYLKTLILKNTVIKKKSQRQMAIDFAWILMGSIIRGVKDIIYTEIVEVPRSNINPDGSISNIKIWAISTSGTNLEEILENPYVDKYNIHTDSIHEFQQIFGIEAARSKIITEIQTTMSSGDIAYEHASIISDEMCSSGIMTAIQKTGLKSREAGNVSLQISFQAPIQALESAATNGIVDLINGVSAPLIYGQVPQLGTTHNEIILNEAFIEKHLSNENTRLEEALA